jgi:predicted Zn-dependent peptidase
MVLAGAGGVDHDHLVKLAEKYFGDMTNHYPRTMPTLEHCRFTGSEVRNNFVDPVNQIDRCAIAMTQCHLSMVLSQSKVSVGIIRTTFHL